MRNSTNISMHTESVKNFVIPFLLQVFLLYVSGKTLAFVVPLLNKILKCGPVVKEKRVFGIIISPTQELALQTDAVVKQFSEHIPQVKTCLFVGGSSLHHLFVYFRVSVQYTSQ